MAPGIKVDTGTHRKETIGKLWFVCPYFSDSHSEHWQLIWSSEKTQIRLVQFIQQIH